MQKRTRFAVVDYLIKLPDARVKMQSKNPEQARPYIINGVIDARDPNNWEWDTVTVAIAMNSRGGTVTLTRETLRLVLIEALQAAIYDELDQPEEEDYNPELDPKKN